MDSDSDLPTPASHVAGVADMHHHAWFVGWDGVFLPGMALNLDPSSSTSWIAGITDMSYCAWPLVYIHLLYKIEFHYDTFTNVHKVFLKTAV
jgi:hypothetical protein